MVSKTKTTKSKARIGRPPVAEKDRRATPVRVLVTEAEHVELQKAAQAASASVSTWVRQAALENARRERRQAVDVVDR